MEISSLILELRQQGVLDQRVLTAIEKVPREQFVSAEYQSAAYENCALPIPCDQTISQPLIVGLMTQALELQGTERVLEVGTGSGYQTAILSQLAAEIMTVERWSPLTNNARCLLPALGFRNISYFTGDGTLGLAQRAPFDAILVTAAAPRVPPPYWEQLKLGGKLVIPLGEREQQKLVRFQKTMDGWEAKEICLCRFVQLVGQHGWAATPDAEDT